MRSIVFRKSALADLEAMAAYFDPIDTDITVRIVRDIESSVARLIDFPNSGEKIPKTDLRKIVSRRYRFTISYLITRDQVAIVGVFRFQNRET